jgi:hypothetical protein
VKKILLHPSYFPSIAQMVAVAKAEEIIFEVQDNYQKQTYRNRAYIAHSNGKLLLNVPIKHTKDGRRQKTIDVRVENDFAWQSHHWKSLQSAYRTSPFFEFYEDDLEPLFTGPVIGLMEHNLHIFSVLMDLLGIDIPLSKTEAYQTDNSEGDYRFLIQAKKEKQYGFDQYIQVLVAHHGYLENLSVLDLLFNEGPNSLSYLEAQEI